MDGILSNPHFFEWNISNFATWTIMLPLLVGAYRLARLSYEQWWLWIYLQIVLVFEYVSITTFALNRFDSPTNLPYYHFITPVYFATLVMIYRPFLNRVSGPKVAYGLMIGFAVLAALNTLLFQDLFTFNSYALAAYCLLLIGLAVYYLLQLLRTLNVPNLERDVLFWISICLLIYCSGSFLLWLLGTYLVQDKATFDAIYWIHAVLVIVQHLLFTIALLLSAKTTARDA